MAERKKKVLFLSDYCGINTGFGKNLKILLKYLYQTGKYDLVNVAGGVGKHSPDFERFPWKTVGVIPNDPSFIQRMQADQGFARNASYGAETIAQIVNEEKPDVIFSIQDSWGALHVTDKEFFKKVPTVCWITFDSLPLLPDTIEKAPKIKEYWSWNDFAREEFHRLGHTHVKTQYPSLSSERFYPLDQDKRDSIRERLNIDKNATLFTFVFRNQVRKLVNTLIEGYAAFIQQNPEMESKSYLVLNTSLGEGWDIKRLCDQYKVKHENVLITYICRESFDYFLLPLGDNERNNPKTGRKTLISTNVQFGISDEQLNEIYNITDLYTAYATSGATELPCIEAAFAGKMVSCAAYSFGEDIIKNNPGSLVVDHTFYAEHGTQFLKSQPSPFSIAKTFKKFINLKPEKRKEFEKASRDWALKNYSIEVNGPKFEAYLDSLPLITDETAWDIHSSQKFNPQAQVQNIPDNPEFIKHLYKDILDMEVDYQYDGLLTWVKQIENGVPRDNIINFFRNVAIKELQKRSPVDPSIYFGERSEKKKVIVVIPRSIGDIIMATSLFKSLREQYNPEEWELHVATEEQYMSLILGNPNVDKWVPFMPQMMSSLWLEGQDDHKGWYDVAINLVSDTQQTANYTENGHNKCAFDLIYE